MNTTIDGFLHGHIYLRASGQRKRARGGRRIVGCIAAAGGSANAAAASPRLLKMIRCARRGDHRHRERFSKADIM
jgi:hypothetical protein